MRPRLRVVDEQGQVHDGCPGCAEAEQTLVQYEKDMRVLKAKLTRLERDIETECRADPLWAEAEAIHEWWRIACWHPRASFDASDFKLVRPHLKRLGPVGCLEAIAGAAFEPGTKELQNGRLKRFDDFELIFRDKAKLESFAERVPGEEGSQLWKTWIVQRIEANMEPKG